MGPEYPGECATSGSAWAFMCLGKLRAYSALAMRIHISLGNLVYPCSDWSRWSLTERSALFLALTEWQRTPLESQKQDAAASETVWMPNKYM